MSLTTEFFNFGRKKSENLSFKNGHFSTNFCHLFASYIYIFHKNEIQTDILRCLRSLNLIWYKSFDKKYKKEKNSKDENLCFVQNRNKKRNGNIFILDHKI